MQCSFQTTNVGGFGNDIIGSRSIDKFRRLLDLLHLILVHFVLIAICLLIDIRLQSNNSGRNRWFTCKNRSLDRESSVRFVVLNGSLTRIMLCRIMNICGDTSITLPMSLNKATPKVFIDAYLHAITDLKQCLAILNRAL